MSLYVPDRGTAARGLPGTAREDSDKGKMPGMQSNDSSPVNPSAYNVPER